MLSKIILVIVFGLLGIFLIAHGIRKKNNREILADNYYHAIGKDFRGNDKPLALYLGIVFMIGINKIIREAN